VHEAERLGAGSVIARSILAVNDRQWSRVLDKLAGHLGDVRGRTVAVLGLAFKPGTSNVRDATSIPLLAGLHAAGATLRAYDPRATRDILRRDSALPDELLDAVGFCGSALEALAGADAAVLVTEWPELVALDWSAAAGAMAGSLVVDGRNALDPVAVAAAGLRYDGVGRPAPAPVHPPTTAHPTRARAGSEVGVDVQR
jgi:UDPglucose 6-dehydrogenase